MRKILCLLLSALLTCVSVSAEEYSSVELEIQLGSYVAYVNGEARSIEAPFLKDGVTVAPIEVISAAFGKESKEKITYNDVTVSFSENSNVALVEKEEKIMPTTAENVNGSLMVPIRFICDTFNALIEYEDATGTVKVSKSADFTELFNKPVSGYWCDEEYGWMIQLPTEYTHTQSAYDGSKNQFINSTGDAAFLVILEKHSYQNIEQLRAYLLAQNSGEILRHEEIITLGDGTKACYLEFEDYAAVVTLHGEYLVDVEFMTTSKEKFELYREDARRGIKSLTFKIDESLNPENVSELNEGGAKLYTDKVLGFNVYRMESWTEPSYLGTNVVVWEYSRHELLSKLTSDELFDGEMKVSVYTKEEGDTPGTLAEAEKQRVINGYNGKYLSNVNVTDFVQKDVPGTQLDYTIIYNGRKQHNSTKYFVLENYVYKAEYYVIYSEGTDEKKLGLDEISKMFDSIRITGAKESKLGNVIDINRRFSEDITTTYSNQKKDFEISIPSAWATAVTAKAVGTINLKKYIEVDAEVLAIDGGLEKAKAYYAGIYTGAKFTRDTFGGKNAYRITATRYDTNNDAINITAYVFMHKDKAFFVSGEIKEVYETPFNKARIDKIIRSFKVI